MRQTVMIVTALMIALLAVSGFIVAGSVEQMRQITEKNTLMDEMALQVKQQTERADELEAQNGDLSASLETAARERDEALMRQQELAELMAQSDAQRVQEGKDQEELRRQAEALAGDYDALLLERDTLASDLDALTEERDTLALELSQAQKALDDAAARSQAASARADELEEQLDALMEESAQTALAYEQRAQEDAQTIETLAAQAESLSQAEAGQGTAPSAAPSLTLPPMPTARPLYTIPMPEK